MTAEQFYDQNIALLTKISDRLDNIDYNRLHDLLNTIEGMDASQNNILMLVDTISEDMREVVRLNQDILASNQDILNLAEYEWYAKIVKVGSDYKIQVYDKQGSIIDSLLDEQSVYKTLTAAIADASKLNIPIT